MESEKINHPLKIIFKYGLFLLNGFFFIFLLSELDLLFDRINDTDRQIDFLTAKIDFLDYHMKDCEQND